MRKSRFFARFRNVHFADVRREHMAQLLTQVQLETGVTGPGGPDRRASGPTVSTGGTGVPLQ